MTKSLAFRCLALFVLAAPYTAVAECPSPGAQKTEKGAPATVGKDGVGGTGWTGGTGGLMAGVENEKKGQSPNDNNSNVAKGLDPTKGVTGSDKGPASGPKPNC